VKLEFLKQSPPGGRIMSFPAFLALILVLICPKMRLNWQWFSSLSPRLPYCIGIFAPKLHRNSTRSACDIHRYEARKGGSKPCPKGESKVTDDASDYPCMFRTFVLIHTGHMPTDFRQKIKYNFFKKTNENPSPLGEGQVFKLRIGQAP
jgi:hypothetical protein